MIAVAVSLSPTSQKNRARSRVAAAFERNHDAIPHTGLFAESGFEVLGINVKSGGRDDHVLFAPRKRRLPSASSSPRSPVRSQPSSSAERTVPPSQ